MIRAIRQQYQLAWRGLHGVSHWARVLENGLRLSGETGANQNVVWLFAVFHDACRLNEDWDPQHGLRGAILATSLRNKLFSLSDEEFELFRIACTHHTDEITHQDVTVQTCWDADRLDIGRVGLKPNVKFLSTTVASRYDILEWAFERSISHYEPLIVQQEWDKA